jgi:hypothetical protein
MFGDRGSPGPEAEYVLQCMSGFWHRADAAKAQVAMTNKAQIAVWVRDHGAGLQAGRTSSAPVCSCSACFVHTARTSAGCRSAGS